MARFRSAIFTLGQGRKGGVHMSSFKVLQMAQEDARQAAELSAWADRDPQAKDLLALLDRIKCYVESLVWCPKNPYKQELRVYLQSRCSLGRAAQRLGVSEKWLYKVVKEAADQLQSRFSGVFAVLPLGNLRLVEREFHKATGDCASPLACLTHRYPPTAHEGVKISACEDELRFLRKLARLEDEGLGLDRDKLEHLLYWLGSPGGNRLIRGYVCQSVYGTLDVGLALARISAYENAILTLRK